MDTASNPLTIRVVLLGLTGSGKSAVGNTLLGSNDFASEPGEESVTTCIQESSGILPSGQTIRVVDTPEILSLTKRDATSNITRCIELLSPGPHAFIFVLQPNRPNREYENLTQCITELVDLFGSESIFTHSLIVMVRKHEIRDDDGDLVDIHEFLDETDSNDLKTLYIKCGKRIVAVDNLASKHEKEIYAQEVSDVISAIDGYFSYEYLLLQKQRKEQEDHLRHLHMALKTRTERESRSVCSIM